MNSTPIYRVVPPDDGFPGVLTPSWAAAIDAARYYEVDVIQEWMGGRHSADLDVPCLEYYYKVSPPGDPYFAYVTWDKIEAKEVARDWKSGHVAIWLNSIQIGRFEVRSVAL